MRKRRGKFLVSLGLYAVRAIDVNLGSEKNVFKTLG